VPARKGIKCSYAHSHEPLVVCAGDNEESSAVIIPREARHSRVEEEEEEESSDDEDDDENEVLVNVHISAPPSLHSSPALPPYTSFAPPPLSIVDEATFIDNTPSRSLYHDTMYNPPPPASSITLLASLTSPSGPLQASPVNVISLPRKLLSAAQSKMKVEPAVAEEEEVEEGGIVKEEEEVEQDYDEQMKTEDPESLHMPPPPSSIPSISPSHTSVSSFTLTIPKLAPHIMSPPAPTTYHVPTSGPFLPPSSLPPTTGLTPEGQAALQRYKSYFFTRHWPTQPALRMEGAEVTLEWMRNSSFNHNRPFMCTNASSLGMSLPPSTIPIRDLLSYIPPHTLLSVIDVATQRESSDWSIAQFVNYYETPVTKRTATCNIISLEVTNTRLHKQFIALPRVVSEMDWMKTMWPQNIPAPNTTDPSSSATIVPTPSIYVQLYTLIGAEGSYTDFHIDFGGSSVWYHVVRGKKMFLLVEPTAENIKM